MAPPKQRNPLLTITFPRNLSHSLGGKKVDFPLLAEDFRLSWLDFIKKHDLALYQVLAKQNRFTIMDIRVTSSRKVWKLNSTIKQFVDSFGKTLQSYKAVMGTQPPNTEPQRVASQTSSTSMPNSSGSNFNRSSMNNGVTARASNTNSPSTKKGTVRFQDLPRNKLPCDSPHPTNTRSSSRNKPGGSAKAGPSPTSPPKRTMNGMAHTPPVEPPRKRPNLNDGEFRLQLPSTSAGPSNGTSVRGIPRTHFILPVMDIDDSASMAPTVDSQDSQDDLREAGVEIEEVKADIINRMKSHFNNSMMLRMRHELQGLIKNQKYFSATRNLPVTANMLQYIFRLNEHN